MSEHIYLSPEQDIEIRCESGKFYASSVDLMPCNGGYTIQTPDGIILVREDEIYEF